jgi:hypothetical protein
MNDGFWINYSTNKQFPINEHEMWIRDPKNAKKLGLSSILIKSFENFKPINDRDKFLLFLMSHAPIMRVRGHGSSISFEYASSNRTDPLDAVSLFAKKNAGPFTNLYIQNFKTNENISISYQDFLSTIDEQGYEGLMRAASKKEVKSSIVKALKKYAKFIEISV